ncbi:MAG: hypothetical protein JST11_29030 [Acidobacteria bacterium]|nr:hypothetical protein [Acidobacteriota bacterium]
MRDTLIGGFFVGLLAASTLAAQEQPLNVNATFSTGYYSTKARGDATQNLDFVPFGARFEITGYYKSADFLNFTVEPEVNAGPQATEAGFQGGNGIRLQTTFFRRLLPITFRYSNLQVEDVVFGSLSQLSGYSLKNRNKDLGVTLEMKTKGLPQTTIDWGKSSVDSVPGIPDIPDYTSHGNHVNVDSNYDRFGWTFDGFFHRMVQYSDLLEPIQGGTQFGSLEQTVQQYQGAARRTLWGDSEVYLNAGSQSTSSMLFTLPIDLATHYYTGSLRLFQKRRVKTLLRANYTSNLASQLLAQAGGSLATAGAIVPDQYALQPFSRGIATLDFTGLTTADLAWGFGAYASLERNSIYGPIDSRYFTASGGLTYNKRTSWGAVSGEYGREYGTGSVTGIAGTIQGQDFRASAQRGHSDGFEIDGTLHGSTQSVRNDQPLSNRSIAAEMSVAHRVAGQFSARLGGGWQWSNIVNSANEFRTNGYTAQASIEHPRFQLAGTLNDSLSNALPFFSQMLTGLGVDSILVTSMQVIPSDYRAMSFSLHANPTRKVELSAAWSRSLQHLDGLLNNDFELLTVYVTYHFRRIDMQAGFIRSNQTFISYPVSLRQRYYVRISRRVKLL